MTPGSEVVEDYLDSLFVRLHGAPPRQVRRMLADTEEHLTSSIAVAVDNGTSVEAAARDAVARFGSPAQVAQAWSADALPQPFGLFLRRIVGELLPLLGVGLLAIGVSGLAARAMTALWGRTFMFAGPTGTTYSGSACRHWTALHASARTCADAYLAESQADGLLARFAAGVLGLLLLGAVLLVRRQRGLPLLARPPLLTSFTAAALFLVAAIALLGLGVDAIRISDGHGAGQWLSGAVVALPLAFAYGASFVRAGRRSYWPGRDVRTLRRDGPTGLPAT